MAVALSLLFVLMASSVSESGKIVRATEGNNVTLTCNHTHSNLPKNPTVIWKLGGKVLPSSNSNFSLHLWNVSKNHSGIYQCHITDIRFQEDFELNVTAKSVDVDVGSRTGGAAVFHPSVCSLATLFILPLYLL